MFSLESHQPNTAEGEPIHIIDMPKPVSDLFVNFSTMHPEFQAYKHLRLCKNPEECTYTIKGSARPDDSHQSIPVILTITQKGNHVDLQVHPEIFENLAA